MNKNQNEINFEIDRLQARIAELKAENARLREALRPFADYCVSETLNEPDDQTITTEWYGVHLTVGDVRNAAREYGYDVEET